MADILKFPGKPRPAKAAAVPKPELDALAAGQYFCTQCEGDTFRLSSAGTIFCVKCGARMRNIIAASTED